MVIVPWYTIGKIALVDGYFDGSAPERRQQLHGSVHYIVCLVSMGAFEELGEVAGGCVVIILSFIFIAV